MCLLPLNIDLTFTCLITYHCSTAFIHLFSMCLFSGHADFYCELDSTKFCNDSL